MAGAFAHIAAVNAALTFPQTADPVDTNIQRIVTLNQRQLELGAISPDLPYVVLKDKLQREWADFMHQGNTDVFMAEAIYRGRTLKGPEKEGYFAWLAGYLAHVITDLTIHPIIETFVGPYAENKAKHREMEMHQDVYIWQRLYGQRPESVTRLSRQLFASLQDSRTEIIMEHWRHCLSATTSSSVTSPDVSLWIVQFAKVLKAVEDDYVLFPFSRHVAHFLNLTYPHSNQIDFEYISQLPTPVGNRHYDVIFSYAVTKIKLYTRFLYHALYEGDAISWVDTWNLDTGKNSLGEWVIWRETSV